MFFPRIPLHRSEHLFIGLSAAAPSPVAPVPTNAASAVHRFVNPAGLYDPAPNGYSHVAMAEGKLRH
ncbi:MAG: hypothetical protein EOO29_30425, partial [Comamonadaceae bacterium]